MYDVVLTSEQAKAAGTVPGTRNTRASTKAERLQGPYDTAVNDERINGIVGRPGNYSSINLLSFSPSLLQSVNQPWSLHQAWQAVRSGSARYMYHKPFA